MSHLGNRIPSSLSTTQVDSVSPDTRGSAMRDSRADLCQQQEATTHRSDTLLFQSLASIETGRDQRCHSNGQARSKLHSISQCDFQ